jgi:predicted AlkP superfamily pyrophosphatase or phosphodiesterase
MGDSPKNPVLKTLPSKEIERFKNIVLIFYDGLGYEFFNRYAKPELKSCLRSKITSIFPSTTAAAATTFVTGLSPVQHAITGWTMLLREIGIVSHILPYRPRVGGQAFSKIGLDPKNIFDYDSIFERISRKSLAVYPEFIIDSDFNSVLMPKVNKLPYNTMGGCFRQLKKALKEKGGKYIMVYWDMHDELSHQYGSESQQVINSFNDFSESLIGLSKVSKDTIFIFSSDHGHIDTDIKKTVMIDSIPRLHASLSLPLCGGSRVAYCYVHPNRIKDFTDSLDRLKVCCTYHRSEDLVKKGYFGKGKANPKIFDRIGDFVIIMKENYTIYDTVPTHETTFLKSTHGGVSSKEMYVPLAVIKT